LKGFQPVAQARRPAVNNWGVWPAAGRLEPSRFAHRPGRAGRLPRRRTVFMVARFRLPAGR